MGFELGSQPLCVRLMKILSILLKGLARPYTDHYTTTASNKAVPEVNLLRLPYLLPKIGNINKVFRFNER